YLRYHSHPTRLLVVDPENSAFYPGWLAAAGRGAETARPPAGLPSRIEGIGRARLEPSFIPSVIDHMVQVPDAASVAAMRHLRRYAGLHAGPSTGTNLWGVWQTVAHMLSEGRQGSVVSLMCDGGERYAGNYWNQDWLASQGLRPEPYEAAISNFLDTGQWLAPPA
ncbi:MAG: PLP-dependent cysteine synthase family protein, partial [Pseudarthrobacter sp.]|nr:PLP-dependent cysteine synthase family protein [Pseudarthrobacter sp.]